MVWLRFRCALAVAAVALIIAIPATTAAHATGGPCSAPRFAYITRSEGRNHITTDVKALIGCAVREWSVPGGVTTALCIANRESGFWPWAHNESSDARGLFQHLQRYWPDRATNDLHQWWMPNVWVPGAYNARANVLVSIRMAHRGGWGPWGGGC